MNSKLNAFIYNFGFGAFFYSRLGKMSSKLNAFIYNFGLGAFFTAVEIWPIPSLTTILKQLPYAKSWTPPNFMFIIHAKTWYLNLMSVISVSCKWSTVKFYN